MLAIPAAGELMRLDKRLVPRHAPINPSRPTASTAAGGPSTDSIRNTNTSAAPIEYLVRGIWTGNQAATATNSNATRVCSRSGAAGDTIAASEAASASAPASAIASHIRNAAGV